MTRLLPCTTFVAVFAALVLGSATSAEGVRGEGVPTVRVLLAREVAAQNAGHWHRFYLMYDPAVRRGNCSYRAFYRSWHGGAVAAGLTSRKGHRLRYSNIHIWTDDVTGSYAFASYDMHIGSRFVGHVRAGEDSFVRRAGRWYDRFENGEYAADCMSAA